MLREPRFTLTSTYALTTPNDREQFGRLLTSYALDQCSAGRDRIAADLYYLAADAYSAAASASIGHNRADRYEAEARRLRTLADSLADRRA